MEAEPVDVLRDALMCEACVVHPLSEAHARRAWSRWTVAFCERVRRSTGHYRHGDHHWRAFSQRLVRCMLGNEALLEYLEQPGQPVLVMPESWAHGFGYEVSGPELPDLSRSGLDVYVFPDSLTWTMAFPHDGQGPYFCRREWAETIP